MAETTVAWNVDSNLVDEVIYQFEKAFKDGKNPNPDDYLKGEGLTRWRLLMELLHSDLELRLRAGQSVKVADYLVRYPEIAKFPNEVIVLLETEIRLLKQMGKQPDPQIYEEQFGSVLGDRVKELFSRVRGSLPVIPGYEILDTIGHGGMGVVYRARHLLLNREVALKLIRPEKMRDEASTASFKARFRREAESVASINHPNVVQIYETGDYDGTLFLAMELVKGQSLQKHIDSNGVMSPQAAAGMFIKLAMGLQAVHEKQIIHRDLKPENILLNEQLEPKISDFGLARPLEGASHETAAGTPVGTPAYMSPEQASLKDEKITPLVDVYGLGATLYCALTGHAPFPRESLLVTLEKVRTENVLPIRDQRKEVPLDLETICLKCLSKDAGKRYSDAKELADELRRFAKNEPIHARPVGRAEKTWRWCKRHPMIAGLSSGIAALLLAATAVSSGLSWWALKEKERADGNAIAAKDNEDKATKNAAEILKEKQRAEQLLALQSTREGLYQWQSGNHHSGLLWITQPLVISADRPSIIKSTRERLASYRKFGDTQCHLRQLFIPKEYVTYRYPDRSPELIPMEDSILHEADKEWMPSSHNFDPVIDHAAFSPDGRKILTVSGCTEVWDCKTGKIICPPLNDQGRVQRGVNFAVFSPDGRKVVTASSDNTARVWDCSSGQPLSPPFVHKSKVHSAVFSPDGNNILTASEDRTAVLWDSASGIQIAPPLIHNGGVYCAMFSLDGKRIVTVSSDRIVSLWDAKSCKLITKLNAHSDIVTRAEFSRMAN